MLNKFLKEVVILVVGKSAEQIAELLETDKHVNEFTIAKKMDLTINQVRNILYKLADQGLVSSVREKDKKKGWYTYFWKIEVLKSLEFLKSIMEKQISQVIFQKNSREAKQFYVCERCNLEFNEEHALLKNFTCNECGGVFSLKDNSKILKELSKRLERLTKELALIDEEISIEKEKLDKVKVGVLKKQEKERVKKKAEASVKRKADNLKKKKEKEKQFGAKGKTKKVDKKRLKKTASKKPSNKKKKDKK
jgi:transcription factor E